MMVAMPWKRMDSPKELANLETPKNSTSTAVLSEMKTAEWYSMKVMVYMGRITNFVIVENSV